MTTSIQKTIEALLAYETDKNRPADGRRVIRDERMALMTTRTTARAEEAARVLAMWA